MSIPPGSASNPFSGMQAFFTGLSERMGRIERKVGDCATRLTSLESTVATLEGRAVQAVLGSSPSQLKERVESTRAMARIAQGATVAFEHQIERDLATKTNAEILTCCGSNAGLKLRALGVLLRSAKDRAVPFMAMMGIPPKDPALLHNIVHLNEVTCINEIFPETMEGMLFWSAYMTTDAAMQMTLLKQLKEKLGCDLESCVLRPALGRGTVGLLNVILKEGKYLLLKELFFPLSISLVKAIFSYNSTNDELIADMMADPAVSSDHLSAALAKASFETDYKGVAKRALQIATVSPQRFKDKIPGRPELMFLHLLSRSPALQVEGFQPIFIQVFSKLKAAGVLTDEELWKPYGPEIKLTTSQITTLCRRSILSDLIKAPRVAGQLFPKSFMVLGLSIGVYQKNFGATNSWSNLFSHRRMNVTLAWYQWALLYDLYPFFLEMGGSTGWKERIQRDPASFALAHGRCLQFIQNVCGVDLSAHTAVVSPCVKTLQAALREKVTLRLLETELHVKNGADRLLLRISFLELKAELERRVIPQGQAVVHPPAARIPSRVPAVPARARAAMPRVTRSAPSLQLERVRSREEEAIARRAEDGPDKRQRTE